MRTRTREVVYISLLMAGSVWAGTPWSQFHGSAAHEGRWDGQIHPAGIEQIWTSAVGGLNRSAQPAVSADGSTIFVYADDPGGTGESVGKIYGINAGDGSVKWTSATVKSHVSYSSWSSPVYHDGFVYWVGHAPPENLGDPETFSVYKIDAANGATTEWSGYSGAIVNASPTIAGGKLFVSTYGGFGTFSAQHYAIDTADGSVAWSNSDGGQGQGAMAYDSGRNLVYQTVHVDTDGDNTKEHRLRAYNADTGGAVWTANWNSDDAEPYRGPYQSAVVYDDLQDAIYFQDYNFFGDGKVYASDAGNSGSLNWSENTPLSGSSAVAIAPDGSVFAYGGEYTGPGQTRCYSSGGTIAWTFDQGGGVTGSPGWADGLVFVGAEDSNSFFLLDAADRSIVRTLNGSGPVAFGVDAFYTVGYDGVLYSYSVPEPATILTIALGFIGTMRRRRFRL